MEGVSMMPTFPKRPENTGKKLSKGERKGWVHKSQYKWTPVNKIEYESFRVEVYPENRYGFGKIVP